MTNSTNRKNIVFPNNKKIKTVYFLIEISYPGAGHLMCFLVKQAYAGRLNDATESRLWNQVNAQCRVNEEKTGLTYTVRACGSKQWCLSTAKQNHYSFR